MTGCWGGGQLLVVSCVSFTIGEHFHADPLVTPVRDSGTYSLFCTSALHFRGVCTACALALCLSGCFVFLALVSCSSFFVLRISLWTAACFATRRITRTATLAPHCGRQRSPSYCASQRSTRPNSRQEQKSVQYIVHPRVYWTHAPLRCNAPHTPVPPRLAHAGSPLDAARRALQNRDTQPRLPSKAASQPCHPSSEGSHAPPTCRAPADSARPPTGALIVARGPPWQPPPLR